MTRPPIKRPDHSTWGDWGPDDQLGRLNLIGPEQVLKGVKEVREGKTFCLSLPLDLPGGTLISPVRHPPKMKPVIRNGTEYYNYCWCQVNPDLKEVAADDSVTLYTQYSTQWDSLAHRGALFDPEGSGEEVPCYYNGVRAEAALGLDGDGHVKAHRLGVEHMAVHGVQGRGVLVDFHRIYGNKRHKVGYDDLMRALDDQKVVVEPGDIFCFWTGLDRLILDMKGEPEPWIKHACAVLDGRDERLLEWIETSGVAAIGSDSIAVEAAGEPLPDDHGGHALPLHDRCLFRLGVHLGELWHLADLAVWLSEHDRSRFLLTAPPLRLPGAVGSPVTPIATV
ncbi:cyclase family protein [Haloferula sp. A504]|uniref:cyclase family protein n=1 Tax=Haloferula sp. A504 TaxID=3373601 RepID=UPI0031C4379F|nr:cyclase family protein [Verrucomicrobiaceae bacterium E54]